MENIRISGKPALLSTCAVIFLTFSLSSCDNPFSNSKPIAPKPVPQDTLWWTCDDFDSTDFKHFSVLYPKGGENFRVGDTVRIRVCSESDEYMVEQTDRELSVDGGGSWIPIFTEMDGPEIVWVIPLEIEDVFNSRFVSTLSSHCRIRVTVYSAQGDISTDRDTSDNDFVITAP